MWRLQRHHVWLKQEHVGLFQQSIFSSSWLRNVRVSTLKLVPFKISTTFSRASVRGKKKLPLQREPTTSCVFSPQWCASHHYVPHYVHFRVFHFSVCKMQVQKYVDFCHWWVFFSKRCCVRLSESLPSVIKIWDSDTASVRANDPLPSHVAVIDSFCNA